MDIIAIALLIPAAVFLVIVFLPKKVGAVEFVIAGPRAIGMGGTGVAVTTDALATYWNPAGLAMEKSTDFRIQGSIQLMDHLGFGDTINQINNINTSDATAANLARLQGLLDQLRRPEASYAFASAGGLYIKEYSGDHTFGLNVSDVAVGGEYLPASAIAFVGGNGRLTVAGKLTIKGLEKRQVGFSYAHAFKDRTFSLGITAKIIQGALYSNQVGFIGPTGDIIGSTGDIGFISDWGKAKLSYALGIDMGEIYRPFPWLRFGIVEKDINKPSFDLPAGGRFKLQPQVRGGVAFNPSSSLTLSFDGDITSNQTFVPDVKSRVLGIGAEKTFQSDFFFVRAGVLKNVSDATSPITPTAGLGMRYLTFSLDIGGGSDFRERQGFVSVSGAMTY